MDDYAPWLGLAAWAIGTFGGIWFVLALAIAETILVAGVIMYMEESDGTCGNGGLALFTVLGAFAEPLYGWIFWFFGFAADGGIRKALAHCNRP